ncbi:kinase-like domain-containing protein [Dichotomocladium elegans]|nr:kinase-like domain-containing protein [Dichotomocladium elegans]
MQHVNGIPVYNEDPVLFYAGLEVNEPTWFSAQGGVYRCTTRQSPFTQVAVKKYLVEESDNHPDLFRMPKELVENEIYTMTKCQRHSNILKLLAVYIHKEFVYLVMPFCTGGSLQQYVFDHQLTIGQLVYIVTSIASGLSEIHQHGYIHRDIKCDNIFLVEETNEVVIGDFGVVSISPAADSNVEEAGVVLFWSPELVQRKIVNRKVDIWALGIVILEILNGGKAPYEDERLEEEEIKERILEVGKPAYPENIPSRLVDLLDLCLNPDPKKRGSATDVLQHECLQYYQPEKLFPGTRIDCHHNNYSTTRMIMREETAPLQEPMAVDPDDVAMANALQKLRTMESLHHFNIDLPEPPLLSPPRSNETSTSSLSSTIATNAARKSDNSNNNNNSNDLRRCRLPLRAFKLTEEADGTLTAKEKVLNVIKKRQSISEIYWGQGSRLPMFKSTTNLLDTIQEKKIKRAKSLRLPKEEEKDKKKRQQQRPAISRKPLTPAAMLPADVPNQRQQEPKNFEKNSSTRKKDRIEALARLSRPKPRLHDKEQQQQPSPPPSAKKKASLYRRKCLPGETRTARLMMGISTTGRVRPSREDPQQQSSETISSTATTSSVKKRPVSFVSRQPEAKKIHPEKTKTMPLSGSVKHNKYRNTTKSSVRVH